MNAIKRSIKINIQAYFRIVGTYNEYRLWYHIDHKQYHYIKSLT